MLSTDYPFQCKCGQLQGTLRRAAHAARLSCYCRDCQTSAHALGNASQILDQQGGTEVVATLQQHLRFTAGTASLACMSLSPHGLLRWYASCCDTPIANIVRNPKLSYVGIVHTCLGEPLARAAAFGSTSLPVNTSHAKGAVAADSIRTATCITRIIGSVLRARVTGTWKRSPFFDADNFTPVLAPRVLTLEERERARRAV